MTKSFTYTGLPVHYRVTGSGKPVMLVHGFGEDSSVWRKIEHQLAEKYRLIIPDLPGSGQSASLPSLHMTDMAEVLNEVLLREEISRNNPVTMIGHSMGGYITLAFVSRYTHLLNAFGLFHSSAFADTAEKKMTRQKGIQFIEKNGAFAFLKNTTPNLFSPQTQEQSPQLVNEQVETLRDFSAATLIKYYEGMMARPDHTVLLQQTPLPVLFIAGKYDAAVPFEDSLKQCHLPDTAYFHALENSGHMGMLEQPALSVSIIDDFLTAINAETDR